MRVSLTTDHLVWLECMQVQCLAVRRLGVVMTTGVSIATMVMIMAMMLMLMLMLMMLKLKLILMKTVAELAVAAVAALPWAQAMAYA